MSRIIAINVALLPDEAATARARALNARLRENYPAGFELGDDRLVHVTLAQAFVNEKDLDVIWQQINNIPVAGRLQAERFDYFPRRDGLGSSGWDLSRPQWLLSAQQRVESLLGAFANTSGDRDAFFRGSDEGEIPESTVNYVKHFFSAHSGAHYNPHITLGRAREDFLQTIRAEQFEPFEFSTDQFGVYQLGSHGTCRRALRTLNLHDRK